MDIRHALQHVLGTAKAKDGGKVIMISTPHDCQSLFQEGFAILFKHSLSCSFSAYKFEEILDFYSGRPEIIIHVLSVQIARPASRFIEEHTRIRHETPQVLVMQTGLVAAHASRSRITQEFLAGIPGLR